MLPARIVTRESLLRAAGFEPERDVRAALTRTREALDATSGTGRRERADHRVRLEAADRIYDLADVRRARDDESLGDQRPVNVAIVLSGNGHDAGAALQTHGVRLHLSGDDSGDDGESR